MQLSFYLIESFCFKRFGSNFVFFSILLNSKKMFDYFFLALRGAASGQNVISRKWTNGKPADEFNYGSKTPE